ncbi:probable cell division protein kinase ECU08_0230 [Etheostoma spectabile]|uniref:probable cell division protein kinase ECU08_0230 n=1 Tax=Etheostoma spectabile TaxID=54343 RepID=UPI0013AEC434|nr:probable cell division protein kinase ECU08_0230 [Etheostoma spectabile]
MENYLTGAVIGEGAYGTVYKATCGKTGKEFALKLHKHGLEDATVRELSCLTALQGHPYVIQMHECFIHNGKMAMLMSYAPYTLSNVIHTGHLLGCTQVRALPLSFVARFSVQVAEALSHMHRLNLVHRDLTPFNVLLTEDLTVQVADMGLSRHSCKWMSTPVVTEVYRAPELFVKGGLSEYTCSIDMWSLGVMIVEAMEGKVVFANPGMFTYEIIVRTLCPQSDALGWTPCDPNTIMSKVMECALVKRIVFQLLAFRENERLLAHELLKDTEWTEAAYMTKADKDLVRDRIDRKRVDKKETSNSVNVINH